MSRQPVAWVGIFGSFARDEMEQDSDIDVAVDFKAGSGITLFDYVRYKLDLEELLGRKVDLVPYKDLRPRIKPYIDKDLQIIYEAA
jgi:hypothetical protein